MKRRPLTLASAGADNMKMDFSQSEVRNNVGVCVTVLVLHSQAVNIPYHIRKPEPYLQVCLQLETIAKKLAPNSYI